MAELWDRVLPILGFLLCITVVAELSDRIGLFAALARGAARAAGGSILKLWLLVVLVASLSATVLSLDTTAVLVTPVVLALASQLHVDRALFAYTAVWLANTASLLLPVSNLTNLLAWHRMGVDAVGFATLMWPAALTAVLTTVVILAVIFHRSLAGRYRIPAQAEPSDRVLLVLSGIVCGLLGPAFIVGVPIVLAAGAAALILIIGCLIRRKTYLKARMIPWQLMLGVGVLFVLVQLAHQHGLGAFLQQVAGTGESLPDLLRLAGTSAGGANLVDNLPAYLAMEPTTGASPLRQGSLLIGVNTGPLVTPWSSLAILLWAGRCRAAGVSINWWTFACRGLLGAVLVVTASVSALWAVHA